MLVHLLLLVSLEATSTVRANREIELKSAFEGRRVAIRFDMPATERGVDVRPDRSPRVDLSDYAKRLKKYGTALHNGETALVTKVRVKDKLIEFQLDGGGYGTFGDEGDDVHVQPTERSTRERELEKLVKVEKDPVRRKQLQTELDDLVRERHKEDQRLQALSADAEETRKARIRDKALASGSRFNIRYARNVTEDDLTVGAVRNALAEYLDFAPTTPMDDDAPPAMGELRKGIAFEDVETMWGSPVKTVDRADAGFAISTRTYTRGDEKLDAVFVEGVLVRYRISSK